MKTLWVYLKRKALYHARQWAWPRWYLAGALVLLVLIGVELIGTWAGGVYPVLGFAYWAYKQATDGK
jgi:hypothetical protein